MSLIHTCELCEAKNAFDYLTELQKHATELAGTAQWMPWNYLEALLVR